MHKQLLTLCFVVGIFFPAWSEILFQADYGKNLNATAGGKEIAPVSGSGIIAESGGSQCLQASEKFKVLKYPCRSILPDKIGAVELEIFPHLTAKQQQTGKPVFATFFSIKSPARPDYAGFSVGANCKAGGKIYLWVIVAGNENAQVYREVSMPDGKWCKIVASWSETTLSLFLNGKLVGDVKRPEKLFADEDISIGGYGISIAESGIKNVKIYNQSPFLAPTDNITFEFPEKPGKAALFKHVGMSITRDRMALALHSDQPVNLKIKTAVFEVKPNQGYAVNFSGRPHGFYHADANGVLTVPLLTNYTYNTIVIVPADITNLLSGVEWQGRVDNTAQSTLGWGHEGGDKISSDAATGNAGVFSSDDTISRNGKSSLKLEKLVRDGEVRYQSSPVKLEPGQEYILSGYYHTGKAEFGAAATFGINVRNQDGQTKNFNQVFLNPLIAPILGEKWHYAFVRFKAPAEAVDGVVRLGLRGTAGQQLWWNDLSLCSAPPISMNVVQELSVADTAPVFSVKQVREYWSKREPVKVETENSNGLPVLHVDGKPIPSLVYSTYEVATQDSEIKPMLNAGIKWYFVRIHPYKTLWWAGKKKYDFKDVQESIERALQQDKNAVIMLSVRISPKYRSWGEEHPDGIWRDHDGDKIAGDKSSARKLKKMDNGKDAFWAHSYSAESFRESAAEALRALVAHLKTFEAGKAVAGMTLMCGTDNQWFPHVNYRGFDYSTGAQKDFHNYLKEIYNNDVNALRKAWGNNNVTFDTAELAPFNLRNRDNVWFLNLQNGTDRWIFDSNRYNDVGVAKTADYLGLEVKKAFGRNVFINLYAPDIMQGYSGRSARKIILESKGVDGVVSVPEYGMWRQPGRT
ncbi:MAG: LamG-like jellyroll fold domain-containing protein, partial [Victivallaceae bacterium]